LDIIISKNIIIYFYESQQNYAIKNGYDFKIITNFLDKNVQDYSTISLNKLLVCSQDWSNDYDFIIFIDADILININSPPIHNYIDYNNFIGIIDEYSQPSNERRIKIQKNNGWETSAIDYYKLCGFDIKTEILLNSGVLVLQPKIHKDFLHNIYNKYINHSLYHPRGFHFEQSCIGYEIQKENLYILLPSKFNAIWALTKADNIENISLEQYFYENYFTHFAGHVDYNKVKNVYIHFSENK
jgi:hypothetical protein